MEDAGRNTGSVVESVGPLARPPGIPMVDDTVLALDNVRGLFVHVG